MVTTYKATVQTASYTALLPEKTTSLSQLRYWLLLPMLLLQVPFWEESTPDHKVLRYHTTGSNSPIVFEGYSTAPVRATVSHDLPKLTKPFDPHIVIKVFNPKSKCELIKKMLFPLN